MSNDWRAGKGEALLSRPPPGGGEGRPVFASLGPVQSFP